MSRPRGGIIGAKPAWTTTATSGIWTLRQAVEMQEASQWPRGPVAPTSLLGTAGDGQVTLTWTAPGTTHGTITNYAVEYTPSGGSATVVLTGSTSASYTVTGLTNETEYTFRVRGINHTTGDWSSSVAVTAGAGLFTFVDPTPSFSGSFTSVGYADGPSHGRGSGAFIGGVLAPNGKVILVPWNGINVGIYDPVANTYTNGPSQGTTYDAFMGGVLAPNGKVILVPLNSTTVGVYDPVANTYTNGPAHGRGDEAFFGGVLAPNGKVILIPRNASGVGVYDPVANTYTTGPASPGAFSGGVLAPNGKVVCVSTYGLNIGIYTPAANTYANGPAHSISPVAFWGGALTPSGRVILAPFGTSAPVGIYDPVANTYTGGPAHGRGTDAFMGGVLAPNGKVILVPYRSTNVGIVTPDPLISVSPSVAMSPYINKF